MYHSKTRFLFPFVFLCLGAFAQGKKEYHAVAIGFYNVENLFSPEDDPHTVYNDRTPRAEGWYTEGIYEKKLANIARVISELGHKETGTAPAMVGLCEIENKKVIQDLIAQEPLQKWGYGIVHHNSPDLRGIDVALIYQKKRFRPIHTESKELLLYDRFDPSKRHYTRDQLVVTGLLETDTVHIIVNHWPSRYGGEVRSRPSRIKAAELNRKLIDSLHALNPYAKILTMGDFNDDPVNTSIRDVLYICSQHDQTGVKDLYNPMEALYKKGVGTLAWRDNWNLFDQIIMSHGFLTKDYTGYQFYKTFIYNPPYLANPRGRYKGYPYRAFAEGGFTGGYSDHFPVYAMFIKAIVNSE